ncbi:hypothetical protein [Streptomyces sp. NPDC058252]|uniref:hypothetical protein n=1 Tax=Streptomyces sp. NPDC058252 TaxID=3346405 RepID=UPI0036E5B565
MPRIYVPTEIIKVIAVDPGDRKPGEEGVTLLVETVGGPLPLKMTKEVAEAMYHAVYEEVREK